MQSITFPQATNKIAENQDEYITLHAQILEDQTTVCHSLSDRDIQRIVDNKKLWLTFMKPNYVPLTPFAISFAKDVYDVEDPEPLWAFDSESISAEPFRLEYTELIRKPNMTWRQRLKALFFGEIEVSISVRAYSKYDKNLSFKEPID